MDQQTMFALLVDLHKDGRRQGPGSAEDTLRALDLARLDPTAKVQVADIGCGTGASTLVLAEALPHAKILAVDLFPEFLAVLQQNAESAGSAARIETRAESMDALPFARDTFDLLWSEGAIYHMGFQKGLATWRPFLRPGGVIAVSEITWLRPDPPNEIVTYWNAEYPEMGTAAEKLAIVEQAGFDPIGYFCLTPAAWIENYYEPTERRIPAFLARHAGRPEARQVADMERREYSLYKRYHDWFSYGFYIARKRADVAD